MGLNPKNAVFTQFENVQTAECRNGSDERYSSEVVLLNYYVVLHYIIFYNQFCINNVVFQALSLSHSPDSWLKIRVINAMFITKIQ